MYIDFCAINKNLAQMSQRNSRISNTRASVQASGDGLDKIIEETPESLVENTPKVAEDEILVEGIAGDIKQELEEPVEESSSLIETEAHEDVVELQQDKAELPSVREASILASFKKLPAKSRITFMPKDDTAIESPKTISASSRKAEHDKQNTTKTPRITRMFQSTMKPRHRATVFVRPVLKYLPSYRLESKNPFNIRITADFLERYVEEKMEELGNFPFTSEQVIPICRNLSEDILKVIKAKQYDRFKIVVNVTVGEKYHQSFHTNVGFLWDSEFDAMVHYVHDRHNMFLVASVYSLYYD